MDVLAVVGVAALLIWVSTRPSRHRQESLLIKRERRRLRRQAAKERWMRWGRWVFLAVVAAAVIWAAQNV